MSNPSSMTIFMCGDVMTGRGIDQILPHPGDRRLYEGYVLDARTYVQLAEEAHGPIPQPAAFSYPWGEALPILEEVAPDVRIINLETAVTTSGDYWKGKGINYRMHPHNVSCLTAVGIDVCVLANNHVLDWGYRGLAETLQVLQNAGIKYTGAGVDLKEAEAPAMVEVEGKGRVIVFGFGSETSGIPGKWGAAPGTPGVNLLPDLSERTVDAIAARVCAVKRPADLVVASLHWGANWEYEIPEEQTAFAHGLIDSGIHIVHGHSSHHVKGIEIYRGKPVIYGCGDFINDYEGIAGDDWYRGELGLMYFVQMDQSTGKLLGLRMRPTRMKNFRVHRAARPETAWLRDTLNREGQRFGTGVELDVDGSLILRWQ